MDIEGIKTGRKIEKSEYVSKLPKDAGVLSIKEERKVPGIRERVKQARKKFSKSMEQRKKAQIRKLETKATFEEKKEESLSRRYGAKSKTAKMKAELAEYRQRKRAASPWAKGLSKILKPATSPEGRHAKVTKTKDMLEMEKVHRAREQFRGQMEYEREYQQKFGVRPEGSGELPYYKKEHLKPLPKRESPKIGVTNHEHVTKKKSLKDELF